MAKTGVIWMLFLSNDDSGFDVLFGVLQDFERPTTPKVSTNLRYFAYESLALFIGRLFTHT